MTRRPIIIAMAIMAIAVVLVACARDRYAPVDDRIRDDAARAAWQETVRPLTEGTVRLAAVLQRIDQAQAVFDLTAGGAARRVVPAAASGDLCVQEAAVFFRLRHDGVVGWWHFDPRTAQLHPVVVGMSIVRAIPEGVFGQRILALHRYDITSDGSRLEVTSHARLTAGDDREPIVVPAAKVAVFVHAGPDADALMSVPLAGGEVRTLLPADGSSPMPALLADGTLVVALGPPGERRTWRIDPLTGERQPWSGSLPMGPDAGLLLGADGAGAPCVLSLPARFDLGVVLALVAARNPAINRRRALLAAALAEAGELRLAVLPTLVLGVDSTPVEGLLVNSTAAVGDVLAEGLVRGVVGLVQPLFDLPRRLAAAEAGGVRVAIAGDLLADVVAERLADAGEEWCRIQHLGERIAVARVLVEAANTALERTIGRGAGGLGSEGDRLLAERDRREAVSGLERSRELLAHHRAALRRACGIPAGMPFLLVEEELRADTAILPRPDEAERLAVLNRPRLMAARRLAEEAFFSAASGSPSQISGGIGASYGHVRDDGGGALTDYVSLNLGANIPLGALAGRGLGRKRALALLDAQRAAAEAASAAVRDEARMAWIAARTVCDRARTQRAERRWRGEELRVARVWNERGGPDADRPRIPSQLDRARSDYLRAELARIDLERDAAVAMVSLWRALGTGATELRAHLLAGTGHGAARAGSSVWAWRPERLLQEPEPVLTALAAAGVHRIYLACGGDGGLLAPGPAGDSVERLLLAAADHGIAVWALLGEPTWLTTEASPAVALQRIAAFNAGHQPGEPAIAGLKFDLEPHAIGDWAEPAGRGRLTARWLALLDQARVALPALPLWIDLHPDLVTTPMLSDHVDGATLMAYRAVPAQAVAAAQASLSSWPLPLEIGIELRPGASADGSVGAEWPAMSSALRAACAGHGGFAGTALHDLDSLLPTLPGGDL